MAVLSMALAFEALAAEGFSVRSIDSWEELSPSDRDKARRKYEIFKRMPPERQREVERNYQRWKEMRPAEQDRIRRNYNLYRELTPQQRRAVGDRYDDPDRAP